MRVYVESNFVLELTLEQEGAPACEDVLGLARRGIIELAIPAFALVEPLSTLEWRRRERSALNGKVAEQLTQLRRTRSLAAKASDATAMLHELMVLTAQAAAQRFRELREELVELADVLPLSAETFRAAEGTAKAYGLDPGDAIVLASVLVDPKLGAAPSCFLNRNTKDFGDDPSIVDVLRSHACEIFDFVEGLAYVRRATA